MIQEYLKEWTGAELAALAMAKRLGMVPATWKPDSQAALAWLESGAHACIERFLWDLNKTMILESRVVGTRRVQYRYRQPPEVLVRGVVHVRRPQKAPRKPATRSKAAKAHLLNGKAPGHPGGGGGRLRKKGMGDGGRG